jgi:hypothetical protein
MTNIEHIGNYYWECIILGVNKSLDNFNKNTYYKIFGFVSKNTCSYCIHTYQRD